MKKTDLVLPHRLLLNQSLRKEAEKLRTHIDEYQRRYEELYQKNIEELETTRNKLNIEYQQAKENIVAGLLSDVETMQAISDAIVVYVSSYYDRQLAYKKKEIKDIQMEIVSEYVRFLSEQMREIGLEIDILRARKDLLSREADISDIICLVKLSGCALSVEEIYDAKKLLENVNKRMDEIDKDDNKIEWYSLLNVQTNLEERVSFLAEIQFISWVIEQKIQLSKELKTYRDEQYRLQSVLLTEAKEIQREIEGLNSILWDRAKEIRFYWAKPMVFIGGEIEENLLRIKELENEITKRTKKKKSLYEDKENVQHDIDRMKDEHSKDSFRWNRLKREKHDIADEIKDLKSRIEDANSEIDRLKSDKGRLNAKRRKWNDKRESIQALMRMNAAPLIRLGENKKTDEEVYAEIRIKELKRVEAEGMKAAEETYQFELQKIIAEKDAYSSEHKTIFSEIEIRLENANKELSKAAEQLKTCKEIALNEAREKVAIIKQQLSDQEKVVVTSKKKLTDVQADDSRFVLMRWFSDSPEEAKAKEAVNVAQRKKVSIQAKLDEAKRVVSSRSFADIPNVVVAQKLYDLAKIDVDHVSAEMDSARIAYNERIAEYDKKIEALKLQPERPTREEQIEMDKIRVWKTGQERRAKKRKRS